MSTKERLEVLEAKVQASIEAWKAKGIVVENGWQTMFDIIRRYAK